MYPCYIWNSSHFSWRHGVSTVLLRSLWPWIWTKVQDSRSNDLCFQLWGLLAYDKCNRKEKQCRVWLEIEPRTSHTLGKCSTKWVTQTTTFPPLFPSFHWSYEKFYPKFLCMDFIWPTITSPPHWPPNCNRRKKCRVNLGIEPTTSCTQAHGKHWDYW